MTERLHFYFHALEKEMATHSSIRIPGTGEPGGLPSMGSHRVGRDWSDLAAAGTLCIVLAIELKFLILVLKFSLDVLFCLVIYAFKLSFKKSFSFSTLLVWMWVDATTVENSMEVLKIELWYDPAVPLLGIYLDKNIIQKGTCTHMLIAALLQ